jgi:hypothetical protein
MILPKSHYLLIDIIFHGLIIDEESDIVGGWSKNLIKLAEKLSIFALECSSLDFISSEYTSGVG